MQRTMKKFVLVLMFVCSLICSVVLAACKTKTPNTPTTATYTVSVTCDDSELNLTTLTAQWKSGTTVKASKALASNGEASVELEEGTYTVTLTGNLDGYSFEDATVTATNKTANISIKKNTTTQPTTATYTVNVTCNDSALDLTTLTAQWKSGTTVKGSKALAADGTASVELVEGTYTVTLTGNLNGYSFDDATVTAENKTANISITKNGVQPTTATYTVNVTCDDSALDLTTLTAQWKSGTTVKESKALASNGAASVELEEGTYTVTLTGNLDGYSFEDATVTAENKTANISISKTAVTVTYTVSVTCDDSGLNLTTLTAQWLGDDSSIKASKALAADGTASVELEEGTYTVTLSGDLEDYTFEAVTVTAENKTANITITANDVDIDDPDLAAAYRLYKKYARALGESVMSADEWQQFLEDEGVSEVVILENGDALAYYGDEDDTGVILYAKERTLLVDVTFTSGDAYADLWFKVIAEVKGKEAILGLAKTDEEGVAKITFLPLLGYSSEDAVYTVCLAEVDDLNDADKAGFKAINVGRISGYEEPDFECTVDGELEISVSISFVSKLGVGMDFVGAGKQYIDLVDGIPAGHYNLTITATFNSSSNIYVGDDSNLRYQLYCSTSPTTIVIYIPEGTKRLNLDRSLSTTHKVSLSVNDGIFEGAGNYLAASEYYCVKNENFVNQTYTVSDSLEAGNYSMNITAYGNAGGTYPMAMYVNGQETTLYGIYANYILKLVGSVKIQPGDKISFIYLTGTGSTVQNLRFVIDSFTRIESFDGIDEMPMEGFTIASRTQYETTFVYKFTVPSTLSDDALFIIANTGSGAFQATSWFALSVSGKALTKKTSGSTKRENTFIASPGETLLIYVRTGASNSASSGSFKVTLTMTFVAPEISINGNVISWSAVPNATGYKVYSGTSASSQTTLVTTVTGTSYTISQPESPTSTITYYSVSAIDTAEGTKFTESTKSNAVSYPISLDAPVLTLKENVVTWDAVENATGYKVYVGRTIVGSILAATLDKDTRTFTIPETTEEGYYIVVVALNDTYLDYTAESADAYVTYKSALDAPTLTIDGTSITWNEISYASKYQIKISGTVYDATQGTSSKYTQDEPITVTGGNVTSYSLAELATGSYSITIKAISGSQYYKDSSESKSVTYYSKGQFAKPELRIETDDGEPYLKWEAITFANRYYYNINGEYTGYVSSTSMNLYNNTYISHLVPGENTITIYATNTDGTYTAIFDASEVATITFNMVPEKLATPEVTLEGNGLRWEVIPFALTYIIYCDGKEIGRNENQSSTVFGLTNVDLQIGVYQITVVAINTYNDKILLNSDPSAAKEYTVTTQQLGTPTINASIVSNNKRVSWSMVLYAKSYDVYINNVLVGTTSNNYYELSDSNVAALLTDTSAYLEELSITVVAKNTTNARFIDSSPSDPVALTPVKFATAPVISKGAAGYTVTWPKATNLTDGSTSIYASIYYVYVNGILVEKKAGSTTASYTWTWSDTEMIENGVLPNGEGNYVVTVAAGHVDSIYYNASELSNEIIFTPVKIGTPEIGVNSLSYAMVTWDSLTGAGTYTVYVNGVQVQSAAVTNWNWSDTVLIDNKIEPDADGNYVITVVASRADCNLIFATSDAGSFTRTPMKLETLDVQLTAAGTGVQWEAVKNSNRYDVYVNGTLVSEAQTATSWTWTDADITAKAIAAKDGGYEITVVARARDTFSLLLLGSDASEAIKFIPSQLDEPLLTKTAAGTGVQWEAVAGAGRYDVYVNGTLVSEAQTATSWTWSDADISGKEIAAKDGAYEITVVAKASATTSLLFTDSEKSEAFTLTPAKLGTPEIQKDSTTLGKIVWDPVAGAGGYVICVNGTEVTTVTTAYWSWSDSTVTSKEIQPDEDGTYSITVVAIASATTATLFTDGDASNAVVLGNFEHSGTPVIEVNGATGIKIATNGSVSTADSYNVFVNGVYVDYTFASGSWSWNNAKVVAADIKPNDEGKYVITYTARAGSMSMLYKEGAVSNKVELTPAQLGTPQDVEISGKRMTWTLVTNANRYYIYVNGIYVSYTTSITFTMADSYATMVKAGDVTVTVTAVNTNYPLLLTESEQSEGITYNVAAKENAYYNVMISADPTTNWDWRGFSIKLGLYEKSDLSTPIFTISMERYSSSANYAWAYTQGSNTKEYVWKVENLADMPKGFTIEAQLDGKWNTSTAVSSSSSTNFTITVVEEEDEEDDDLALALSTVSEMPVIVDKKQQVA